MFLLIIVNLDEIFSSFRRRIMIWLFQKSDQSLYHEVIKSRRERVLWCAQFITYRTWIQLSNSPFIIHLCTYISFITTQNCYNFAVSRHIDVVSLLLLVQWLASLNCVGQHVPLSARFPGLCDRREVLWRVFGSRCICVMLRNIFRLINTPSPVQLPPHFSSRWFDLWAR